MDYDISKKRKPEKTNIHHKTACNNFYSNNNYIILLTDNMACINTGCTDINNIVKKQKKMGYINGNVFHYILAKQCRKK